MILIALVCNSTTAKYEGNNSPRVSAIKNYTEQLFLNDTEAQRTCMPFNAFKIIYGPDEVKR
jgi:hypothetical protein